MRVCRKAGCRLLVAAVVATTIALGASGLLTWRDQQGSKCVAQSRDYSCGAASLAALIRLCFQDDVSEHQVLREIFADRSPEQLATLEKQGLSMLDMKEAANRMGYQAIGLKLDLQTLHHVEWPMIVHLQRGEWQHFAVLRRLADDQVYLSDPSRGNVQVSVDRFAAEWNGIAMLLTQ